MECGGLKRTRPTRRCFGFVQIFRRFCEAHKSVRRFAVALFKLAQDVGRVLFNPPSRVELHSFVPSVIPGRASWREPGIHWPADCAVKWIPGSCFARPGMTAKLNHF